MPVWSLVRVRVVNSARRRRERVVLSSLIRLRIFTLTPKTACAIVRYEILPRAQVRPWLVAHMSVGASTSRVRLVCASIAIIAALTRSSVVSVVCRVLFCPGSRKQPQKISTRLADVHLRLLQGRYPSIAVGLSHEIRAGENPIK